jgi:predicted transcriptional regulator
MSIREERKKRVRDLYFKDRRTTREIAKIERISIRDISNILKEEESKQQKNKQYQIYSKAYELFSKGKRPAEVAIALSLREPEATKLFIEYCKLKRLHILISIHKATNGKLGPFLKLYKQLIKQKGMSIEQVVNV